MLTSDTNDITTRRLEMQGVHITSLELENVKKVKAVPVGCR